MFATVCEFASVHGDGTATLVHSGIDNLSVSMFPVPVRLWIYVEAAPGELSLGENQIGLLAVVNGNERELASGKMELVAPGATRLALPFQMVLEKADSVTFRVKVGTVEEKLTIKLTVKEGVAPNV